MSEPVAPVRRPVPRWALPVLLATAVGCLLAAIFLPVPSSRPKPAELDPEPVPDFSLTERSGKTVTKADLLGKVWVASFVFTRCGSTCPLVTNTLHRLQSDLDLANRPDLRLVSISMDPAHDTPEVLARYAAQPERPAHPDRWLFLTGPEATIHTLMKDGFHLALEAKPDAAAADKFNHGTFVFVVDKKGMIRGHFDGIRGKSDDTGERYEAGLARLKATVAALLAE